MKKFVPSRFLWTPEVAVQHLKLFRFGFQGLHLAIKLIVVLVQRVNRYLFLLLGLRDRMGDLDVSQVRDQVKLLLQLFTGVNRKVGHILHAEVVGDEGVETT